MIKVLAYQGEKVLHLEKQVEGHEKHVQEFALLRSKQNQQDVIIKEVQEKAARAEVTLPGEQSIFTLF